MFWMRQTFSPKGVAFFSPATFSPNQSMKIQPRGLFTTKDNPKAAYSHTKHVNEVVNMTIRVQVIRIFIAYSP